MSFIRIIFFGNNLNRNGNVNTTINAIKNIFVQCKYVEINPPDNVPITNDKGITART